MAVTKPDATAFDNANDSIANSRAELYTMATSFNTIADEYNAGTLGGGGAIGATTKTDVTRTGATVDVAQTANSQAFHCTGGSSYTLRIEYSSLTANTPVINYVRYDGTGILTIEHYMNGDIIGSTELTDNNGHYRYWIFMDIGTNSDSAGSTDVVPVGFNGAASNTYQL